MIAQIIDFLTQTVVQIIGTTGYAGVFFLMLMESCGVPAPSEIIMPFSGFLVATGKLDFWLVVAMGTFGNLAGSLLAYYIALKGGRPLIERYGRFIFISKRDLDRADVWFAKHGEFAVFIGRLLPVVRTYISFPAGIAKMDIKKFLAFTLLGCLPWAFLFTYFGIKLQNNWALIQAKLHSLDAVILALIILAVGLYIWRHFGFDRQGKAEA